MPTCQLNININGNRITQDGTRHRHLGVTFNERLFSSHRLVLNTATSESPSMNDCPEKITFTILSKSLPRKLDSSVALAGNVNCLQPLSGISMHSSGHASNMAALSGVTSVPQMLHARSAARLITKISPSSDISRELLLARAGLPSLGTRHRIWPNA